MIDIFIKFKKLINIKIIIIKMLKNPKILFVLSAIITLSSTQTTLDFTEITCPLPVLESFN